MRHVYIAIRSQLGGLRFHCTIMDAKMAREAEELRRKAHRARELGRGLTPDDDKKLRAYATELEAQALRLETGDPKK